MQCYFFEEFLPKKKVKMQEEEGQLATFDPNLLAEIFKNLDWDHLNAIGAVNKHWLSVCKNPVLLSHLGNPSTTFLIFFLFLLYFIYIYLYVTFIFISKKPLRGT